MKLNFFFCLFIFGVSIIQIWGQHDRCNPPCNTKVRFFIGENLFAKINDPDETYLINFGEFPKEENSYYILDYHSTVTIYYPGPGIYTITLKGGGLFGKTKSIQYKVACVPSPDNSYPLVSTIPYCPPSYVECYPRDTDCDTTGHTYSLDDINNLDDSGETPNDGECQEYLPDSCVTIFPHCVTSAGQISILYGCGNTTRKLVKPFVFVEGLDFGSQFVNGQYGDFGWPVFITGVDPVDDPLQIQLLPQFLKKLNADGFDIVLLDYQNGSTYIQANARLLVTLINKIKDELIANNSKHEIVLASASMGGIVAKYALSYMENNASTGCRSGKYTPYYSAAHNVRLFLSFDSPHNGANIPIGDQLLLYFMRIIKKLVPDVDKSLKRLAEPAPNQLLVYNKSNIQDHVPGPHHLRYQLLGDTNMNFPSLPRKVSISNGSCQGIRQMDKDGNNQFGPREIMVNIWIEIVFYGMRARVWSTPKYTSSLNAVYEARISVLLGLVYPGWRRIKNVYEYDAVAGGYRNTNADISNIASNFLPDTKWPHHCFIPTTSALAFAFSNDPSYSNTKRDLFSGTNHAYIRNSSITPFDAIYAPDLNQGHIEITQENIDWMMEEISPEHLYLQNQKVNKPAVYEARNSITSGSDVDPVKTPSIRTLPGDYTIIPSCSDITFRAGEKVTLKDGFSAKMGSKFRAYTDTMCKVCANAMRYASNSNAKLEPVTNSVSSAEHKYVNLPNQLSDIVITPNPMSGLFTLQIPTSFLIMERNSNEKSCELFIYSSLGQLIRHQTLTSPSTKIDLSSQPNGIYFIHIKTEQESFTQKLIIQK
ncbi:MAG: T9SS type A sorting domain-containing protein [Bacteroidota bacterium]